MTDEPKLQCVYCDKRIDYTESPDPCPNCGNNEWTEVWDE